MDAANAGGKCRDSASQRSCVCGAPSASGKASDYLPFPKGSFRNLAAVKSSDARKFIAIKNQYLCDINRLKSLSNRLIGKVYDGDIDEFYSKIDGGLSGVDTQYASLLSFRDTRYHLRFLVSHIESFLRDQSANSPIDRDRLCALLHECLSGINYCVEGSSSRLQSAFIRLTAARNIRLRVNKIRHDALEYAVKLFLAKERAGGFVDYGLGNEVHWHNALYNVACDRFGLKTIIDPKATLGDSLSILGRFEHALPILVSNRDFIRRLADELYQNLISALEKNNKQDWLTRAVLASELSFEITNDIEDEFFQPINMEIGSSEENKLNLWALVESDDDGCFYFSNSYERFLVWLINRLFAPSVTVIANIGFSKIPHLLIGSMDGLYFWVFESASHLERGSDCYFDWDNHQALSMAHLKNVDFQSFPERICFDLLTHSIQYTTKIGEFLSFFLDKSAVVRWKKIHTKNPGLEDILLEKLTSIIRGDGIIQELNEELEKYPVTSDDQNGKYFLVTLFRLALNMGRYDVAGCLFSSEGRKYLIFHIGSKFDELVRAFIVSDECHYFELLVHCNRFSVNSSDERGRTALIIAAEQGRIKFLKQLLAKTGININQKDKDGNSALFEAARNNHEECLCALLASPGIHVNSRNKYGSTALIYAAEKGYTDCLIRLLAHRQTEVNQSSNNGWTALTIAAVKGHTDCLKALLAHKKIKLTDFTGSNNRFIPPGSTSLMISAKCGQADCLQTLLSYDARHINLQNDAGDTALMMAALGGDERCATALLQHPDIDIEKVGPQGQAVIALVANENLGQLPWKYYQQCLDAASSGDSWLLSESLDFARSLIHARDRDGRTPLMLAAQNGHLHCLSVFLAQPGINPDLQDNDGYTALMLAAIHNHRDCLKAMMTYGKTKTMIKNGFGHNALMLAAANNHAECLTLLLADKQLDINDRDNDGLTALMYAAASGYTDCVNALLTQHEIRVNKRNDVGLTALALAAEKGFENCLRALLAHEGIRTDLLDYDGQSSLAKAVKNGHKTCVQLLLECNPKLINLQSKNGMTALMEAAIGESECCATVLLKHPDINIEKVNSQGQTALNLVDGVMLRRPPWQSFQKCLEAANVGNDRLLAEQLNFSRAVIHVRNEKNQTPLMLAARGGHANCLGLLLQQKGINPNARNDSGETALMSSAAHGHTQCLKALLACGEVDINAENRGGWTALTLAAYFKQSDCIRMLLAHSKVKVNHITSLGSNALIIAAGKGHADCLKVLLTSKKIQVDLKHADGWTALMQAARYGYEECVRTLLDYDGGHINMQNNYGYTALMLAAVEGYEGCVSLLLQQPNISTRIKNNSGLTASELAARKERWGCVRLLNEHEAQFS